jgi:hypothetical protein
VLLFAKAKHSQAQHIATLLNSFCVFSGLKVSLEKSRMYASKGVSRSTKESLEQLTHMKFTDRLDNKVIGSSTWKSIIKALSILEDGFSFKIGDGDNNIWFQAWIHKQPLCDLIQDISPTDLCLKINNLWNNDRCIL